MTLMDALKLIADRLAPPQLLALGAGVEGQGMSVGVASLVASMAYTMAWSRPNMPFSSTLNLRPPGM